jgi:glc operon protein GlcG
MSQDVTLTHADAQRAIATIQQALAERNKTGVIAVADAHGELIALARLDGAPLPSINIAINKAYTAARTRQSTLAFGANLRAKGYDITFNGDPRFTGFGGGAPIGSGNAVLGAVSVSGLSQEEDDELAQLGAAAALKRA